MGIEAFNLASSLSLIIAQRLARRLCNHCKKPDDFPDALREKFHIPKDIVIDSHQARLLGMHGRIYRAG